MNKKITASDSMHKVSEFCVFFNEWINSFISVTVYNT